VACPASLAKLVGLIKKPRRSLRGSAQHLSKDQPGWRPFISLTKPLIRAPHRPLGANWKRNCPENGERRAWRKGLDLGDSGSLCHGSNPCEAVPQHKGLMDITLGHVKTVFAIVLPLLRSKKDALGVQALTLSFRIVFSVPA